MNISLYIVFSFRVQIIKEGRKRKIVIKDCKVTDAAVYTCTSNADKTECELVIQCKYCVHDLLNVVETEQYVMNILNFRC